ncbi:FAR1 domain-containing protein [Cephalotus follicularis]|uniref:FAR1 domain-containing protein n=2 Tax=Cephalotus follicularis TaxID=3775 RepID=A0A1Q3CU85_CEPFO|nr:FAR1 domain-containing protein [Cephalotus follicularis]
MTNDEIELEEDSFLHQDSENCNDQESESNRDKELVEAPQPGMTFKSFNELVECYRNYEKQEDFGIHKNSLCYLADGESKLATLSCSRTRKPHSVKQNPLKPNPATKTDCKAIVSAHVSANGTCRVTSVVVEHNHGLNPMKSRFYLCNINISRSAKRQLELADEDGICVTNFF